ncbi:MAG: cytochrome c-type biogenesis protein [Kiloniellales bacterium]|nr:cytochrome c-type biogenesis protein [Kiloniellales bacterium]
MKIKNPRIFWIILFVFGLPLLFPIGPVGAVQPDEVLEDPALEARARSLSLEIRCLVCQNQTIDDSNAELARELRLLVRERILSGDSDRQIKDFLVSRYGDFVLFKPPLRTSTLVIWVGPFVFLAIGLLSAALYIRARKPSAETRASSALTAEERERLDALLREGEEESNEEGERKADKATRTTQ